MARGVSDFAILLIGTGEGAVLTGALAYGLRSLLDRLFANGARSALASARAPAQLGRRLILSFGGGASPPWRRGVNS